MKKILIVIGVMLALILILFVGTGFTKNPNVEIIEYSVNHIYHNGLMNISPSNGEEN